MRKHLLFFVILIISIAACVSTDQYNQLAEVNKYLEEENKRLDELEDENRNLRTEKKADRLLIDQLQQELTDLQFAFNSLDRSYQDLTSRFNAIINDNRQVVELSAAEKQQLEEALAAKQLALEQKERELQFLEQGISQREQRVQDLTRQLEAQQQQMNVIRNSITNALRGFASDDLSVTERDGKIYVSLSQNLLFQSGSSRIDPKGKEAIAQLARILQANAEIVVNVEGHTDTDGTPAANWNLSVDRATSVVKELVNNGLSPERIVASGRGQYAPVATNSTATGKAQNRRTEIILSPKLELLYGILKQ